MSNGNNGKTPPGASFPHKSGNGNGGGNDRIPELPEIALPAKIGRGNIVQNLSVLPVLLNGYNISLVEAIPKVYQHELKFFATDNKGKEKDLSRGPRNDVSNILRHEVLYEIYKLMLNLYKQDFHITSNNDIHRFVYDCGINFYSADKLMNKGEEKRFLIDVTQLSQKSRDYLSQRFQKIEGVLLHTDEIDLKSTSAISENVLERDRSVLQFLEILSSQFLYNKESYYVFRQKMFEKQSRIPIRNDTRIIKSGMQKNIRFIGDSQDKAHPFLQIDSKKSAFYDNIHVMKYLAEMFHCRNEQDLERRLSEPRLQRQVARELKGIVVKTTHMTNNIYFSIHNLTEKGPDQIFFETRDGRQQSVKEYLEEKYHFRLRFPSLPCVVEKRVTKVDGKNQSKESYYPMEVLEIFDGQRITRQKMNPALTEEMIRNCQINPAKYVNESEEQRSKAFLSSGAPHFKAFGVKIEANMRAAVGEVLFPPAIQYGNEVVNLPIKDREGKDDVAWQINRKRFVKGAEVRCWVAALFQKGISPSVCNEFVQQLVQNARQFGMNLPNPAAYEEIDSTEGEFVRQKMKLYKDKNVQYILFFTKDKQDPVHNTMKLLEVEFSIPTQHVSSQTIQKVQSGRGAQLVFGNILQKMNLKLGGINHDIVTAQAFQIKNNRRDNIVKDSWLKQTRMFIGIDMSHAGPQSLFERQAQIPSSEPTIVGMAYTVGHPVNIRGTYWCQKPRLTIIENLADKVSTAILNFQSQTNGFPTHLIVYRSGISEGEYAKVITQEESYFKEAFELVAKSNPSFRKPTLTIIVVQRNSNYRVVPQHIEERAPAVKQNCPSGTVVDREVMHPTQTEFLLTAQKAIQGTAHPCKCTVVFDDSAQRISLEELEYVTYALCFGHGIVTSPVSVPAPLYSAGDLAKRGRNNWKEHNFGSDSASVMSGESGGRFRNAAGDPDFFINLSENLKPSINNTKFWA